MPETEHESSNTGGGALLTRRDLLGLRGVGTAAYLIKFTDGGTESRVSGKELMESGIYMSLPEPGASEIALVNEA